MKKASAAGFLAALVLGAAATAPAQTAQDVLAKMIDAQGGRKVLESLRDSTAKGALDLVSMGMSGSVTIYQKEPNKMRMDIEVMGTTITQATDGATAWFTNPQTGAVEEMAGRQAEDFKRQALGFEAVLSPEKFGLSVVLKGREKIGTKEYLVLEQAFKDGPTSMIYVDPATHLTFKVKGTATDLTGAEVETETVTEDYRKVGGTMAAHKMTVFQNGAEFVRILFTEFGFNAGLEDSLFQKPKPPVRPSRSDGGHRRPAGGPEAPPRR
ncbi:MAG: outer membrane lipoprotein-sorting protein [Candidatus Aminicenantes bacterium]|nr:outer membrane lipoprotein-sorting protein [Candidatus Aminicenantes bacterium]